jgi:PD-(D/E)XK nuclease superfamily protein
VLETVKDYIDARLVHEVHTSERKSYRGCRRRWNWLFQEFWYPKTTAKPLEFGVAFHYAMEILYDPETWSFDREVVLAAAMQGFKEKCNEQRKNYLALTGQFQLSTVEAEEDYNERIELGIGMLKYYAEKIMPKYDKMLKPLRAEQEFIVQITNPETGEELWCKCKRCKHEWEMHLRKSWTDPTSMPLANIQAGDPSYWDRWKGLPVCLAGRLDVLMEDNYGHYWIVDWKTAARLSTDNDEFLALDDQIASYVMALRRKLGLDVAGFIYVEFKKAVPTAPKLNVNRRLGCAYSVSKSAPVQYDLYLETVMEKDKAAYEAGCYDEYLDWLKAEGPRYHERYQIVKSDEELWEIEMNLFLEAKEMTNKDLIIYPSSGRFSCSQCAFRQPCLEKNRQGDYQYLLDELFDRKEKHYWVKELSTDKQGGE